MLKNERSDLEVTRTSAYSWKLDFTGTGKCMGFEVLHGIADCLGVAFSHSNAKKTPSTEYMKSGKQTVKRIG